MCNLFKKKEAKMLEPPTPAGIIDKEDVFLTPDGTIAITSIPGRIWLTTVADTNSMLPLIDAGDIAILTAGFNHNKLQVGDVIVYRGNVDIIHRIIEIGETQDDKRIYTCRGDNNSSPDPYQILDEHISWLLVGIIYCKKDRGQYG